MNARIRAVVTLVLLVSAAAVRAQSTDAERPRFDVASVKPNKNSEGVIRFEIQPGGRMVITDIPVKQLIRAAYTLQLYQIVDAPSWTESERFDITGVTERELREDNVTWSPGGKYALVQLMMQSLLGDRFNLRAHFEERQGQVYALVLDDKGRAAKGLAPARPCGTECGMKIGSGTLRAPNVELPLLAELLSQLTGRPVTDATGLAGNFEINLRWTPETQEATADAPSLFTALPEQLGLRLEARRGPISMLVVDSVDRPTPD
ncbi:MAG: TIGR03435 family protein [Vicinamibacterales bacterium]